MHIYIIIMIIIITTTIIIIIISVRVCPVFPSKSNPTDSRFDVYIL